MINPAPAPRLLKLSGVIGIVLLASIFCGGPAPARAVGIGPYIDFSGGSGEFEWDTGNYEFDVDVRTGAIGLILDTAPISASNFSYRLNIGLERQDLEDDYDATLELGGLVVENVFCFAVERQRNLNWWIGPLVRFGIYSGETDDSYIAGERIRTEADLFEFGIGVATGLNIRVNRSLILAPSAGFRLIGASGEGTEINYTTGTRIEDDLTGGFSTAFINFALLFE